MHSCRQSLEPYLFLGDLLEGSLEVEVSAWSLQGQLTVEFGKLAALVAQGQGCTVRLLLVNTDIHTGLQGLSVVNVVALDLEVNILQWKDNDD